MTSEIHRRRRSPLMRAIALATLFTFLVFALACYGNFPLTKAVYEFNGEVTDNELGQSILFWVFIILPVYSLAQLGDALIFNLIEFWTGESLDISAAGGPERTQIALSEDGSTLAISAGEQGVRTAEIAPGTFEVTDLEGNVTGLVHRTDAGDLEICDAEGTVLRVIRAEELAALAL